MKDLLKNIDELLSDSKIAEALELCQNALQDKSLSQQDQETLSLQCIRCAIHVIQIDALVDTENPNAEPLDVSASQKGNKERLEKYILKLLRCLTPDDYNKISKMYFQVSELVLERFLQFLPDYIDAITDLDTFKHYHLYFRGYLILSSCILDAFIKLRFLARIENKKFPNFPLPFGVVAETCAMQANKLAGQIQELSADFPYFTLDGAHKAIKLYYTCDQLLDHAIINIGRSESCDNKQVLNWKMRRVNIKVDTLNIIVVDNGNRFSYISDSQERAKIINRIHALETEIRLVDSSYSSSPYNEEAFTTAPQKQGCYIATAVYGSYDCPQVWVLRRYRDNVLAQTAFGKLFIRAYYAISPRLVKSYGQNKAFIQLFRSILDRFVLRLQKSGLSDTPYQDKM